MQTDHPSFRNLPVRQRLLTAFALVVLVLLVPVFIAYTGIDTLETRISRNDADLASMASPGSGSRYLPADLSPSETAKRVKTLVLVTSIMAVVLAILIALATTRVLTAALGKNPESRNNPGNPGKPSSNTRR